MTTITFKISYHNGDASNGHLDMYDASVSLMGFAKALSITTHALLNDGEIKKKGNRIDGATLYISPPKRGSFEEIITLVIDNKEAIGASIAANAFYDLIKWTWSKTLDLKTYKPVTPLVRKFEDRIEPFIEELEEALVIPLEQAHKPIKNDEEIVIVIKRPRVGNIIRLDSESLKSVSIETEQEIITGVSGNVTRFNILTNYGRFFDDDLERTVSFELHRDVPANERQMITWSLYHAQAEQGGGKLVFEARRTRSAKGKIKKYMVYSVSTKS